MSLSVPRQCTGRRYLSDLRPTAVAELVIDWSRTEAGSRACQGIADGMQWAERDLFQAVIAATRQAMDDA